MYQDFIPFYSQRISHCYISFMQSSTDKHLGCFHLWLLWIVLLWTFMNRFLLEHFFSILLSIYVRVELLSHMITQFKYLRNYQTVFPWWLHLFTLLYIRTLHYLQVFTLIYITEIYESSNLSTSLLALALFCFIFL